MLCRRSMAWLLIYMLTWNDSSVYSQQSGAVAPLTPAVVVVPVIPSSPTMTPMALTILPTTSISPTRDCDYSKKASNDKLFRNTTTDGEIVVTIHSNETYVLPPPSTLEITESVFERPLNGVLFQNKNDLSLDYRFIYTPNPTFVGTDTFEIDQCLLEDTVNCVGDCRYVNIVVHVISATTVVITPEMNTTTANVVLEAPQENTSERSLGLFYLFCLTILPFLGGGYIMYKYQRHNNKTKNMNSAITSKSDRPLDDEVGTMIGRIVDVTNDDTHTIVSGFHTISSVIPNRPLTEQCTTVDQDLRPARRLTPVYDHDFSVMSGSTMNNTTYTTTADMTTSNDPFCECDETQLQNEIQQNNLFQREEESHSIGIIDNNNCAADDMMNMLNKLQQQLQQRPQSQSQTAMQIPMQSPPSQTATIATTTAVVAADMETPPPPQAHTIHDDTRLYHTKTVMVDAILISNDETHSDATSNIDDISGS